MRRSETNVFDLVSHVETCASILHGSRKSSLEIQLLYERAELHNLNLAFGAAYCLEHYCCANVDLTPKVRG